MQEEKEKAGQAGATTPVLHNFVENLEWSEKMEQWSFYLLALSRFFPDAGADWERITDLLRQKKGRDIELGGARGQIKARRKDWGDFCAEYRHDGKSGRKWSGWIEQPHRLAWLMYCVPVKGRAWLLDWVILQALWFHNRADWIAKYDLRPSPNPTYYTRNAGIPWTLLEDALINKVDFK